jgi:hypothetical protein
VRFLYLSFGEDIGLCLKVLNFGRAEPIGFMIDLFTNVKRMNGL